MKKKVMYRSQTIGEGGELLRETVVTKESVVHGHTFVMLLLTNGVWWSLKVRSITDVRVFLMLLEGMGNDNVVEAGSSVRKSVSGKLSIAISTVHSAIRNLRNGGILKRLGKSRYMVNPDIAFKTNAKNLVDLRSAYENELA